MRDDLRAPTDSVGATLIRGAVEHEALVPHGRFDVVCYDKDGNEKWREVIDNLVTTVGKNDLLNKYLAGSAYTQTLVMGLKGTGAAGATDTQASHGGWNEVGLANPPTYSGNRKAVTMGGASGGISTSSTVSFAITGSGTVAGCFINNGGSTTIDNTTGTLFSAGDFTGGNRAVLNLDTIVVTYTLTIA